MSGHVSTPVPSSVAVKRSHSPDQDVLHALSDAPKRVRTEERSPQAHAYLTSLTTSELVDLIYQIEDLVQDTLLAADVHALLYPSNMHERLAAHRRENALQTEPERPAPPSTLPSAPAPAPDAANAPTADKPMPMEPSSTSPAAMGGAVSTSPVTSSVLPSAVPLNTPSRPYTPSIPVAVPAQTPAPMGLTSSPVSSMGGVRSNSSEADPLTGGSHISSRIAAILESIQNTNSSGPMLGLQGQPLAPSKQGSTATTGSLSSLLSSSSLLTNNRMSANSALSKLLEQSASSTPSPLATSTSATSAASTAGLGDSLGTSIRPTLSSFTPTYGLHDTRSDDATSQHESPRITSTLPSYEDMIIEGLQAIGDVNGTPPRMLFHWMEDTYPLMKNFRPSASQALQKAFKRGRLHKAGSLYRINPNWDGSNAGRKPTRRPQIGKDHPMMVNGPKGPAPASPFKARAQFEGAAAYRQATVPLHKQRNLRPSSSLRPGPKPYGQPGAAPLDNPASSIFQNGAAAAALLLAHQQRLRHANGSDGSTPSAQDLTPSLTSLVQQLRSSTGAHGDGPSASALSSVLASALLKHAQRPSDGRPAVTDAPSLGLSSTLPSASSPVMQSLSRLLGASRSDTTGGDGRLSNDTGTSVSSATSVLPASGAGSLTASIETLVRQASRATQAPLSEAGGASAASASTSASQADLDAAVSQTLEAAFQQIGPRSGKGQQGTMDLSSAAPEASLDTTGDAVEDGDLGGINLADYSDALRTLSAALASSRDDGDDDEAQRLADEQAIADAEADYSAQDSDDHEGGDPESGTMSDETSSGRMEALLKSYGIHVSNEALQHLTETLRDPATTVSDLTEARHSPAPAADGEPSTNEHVAPETAAPSDAAGASEPLSSSVLPEASTDLAPALLDSEASEAAKNASIQSQLEALIASLAAENEAS
ncbi:hypothetical protein MNAN1_002902 [Malassezia nana]|uniref:Histone H1 n=1 Tax=Malassezia nana TaxID=180528 RepID=A0AAF0J3G6_9BASI|nr:hypothetical protein MNAN1_002902 [Malassezia nana]